MFADLVLVNGQIITCDQAFSLASSIAVRNGRIVAVGSNSLEALADGQGKVVDLQGRCVLPGQVDAYSHIMSSGLDLLPSGGKVNISQLISIEDIVSAVAKRAAEAAPGEWIVTSCMFRGSLVEKRWPNRWDLDRVAPDHPVYIMQGGRPIIANSRALAIAGIDENTPDPQDPPGKIVRDEEGRPTGQLIAGAADLARRRWSKTIGVPPEEWDFMLCSDVELVAALEAQQKVFHACGVTATRDVATMRREVSAFVTARRQNKLLLRTQLMIIVPERFMRTDEEYNEVFNSYFQPWNLGDSLLGICGVAFDYSLDGWRMIDKSQLCRIVAEGNRRGWTVAITPGIGGEDEFDDVLDALEAANAERSIVDRRFPIMHPMGLRRNDQQVRAIKLGVTLNPNPLLNYFAAERSVKMFEAVAKTGLLQSKAASGYEQAAEMWGLSTRDWIDAGFLVSTGSNTPAAIYDPDHPFLGMYSLATGETRVGVLVRDQGVTRREAIEICTRNGAEALGIANDIGTLEAGKFADFTIVDKDILSCSNEQLLDAKILATYFNGELVYER